jgi:hypothetical protein
MKVIFFIRAGVATERPRTLGGSAVHLQKECCRSKSTGFRPRGKKRGKKRGEKFTRYRYYFFEIFKAFDIEKKLP